MGLSASTTLAQDLDLKSEKDLITIANNNGFTGQLAENLKNLRSKPGQVAVIKQVGDYNNASITQNGVNLFAYILQTGDHLDADLILKGSNNSAVMKQNGSYLTTNVKLSGVNNNFKLLQAGTGLSNHIKLLNVTGMDVLFLQTESAFYYSQNGGIGIPLKLTSNRDVPTIIVTNSKIR